MNKTIVALLGFIVLSTSIYACVTVDKDKGTYTIDKSGCVGQDHKKPPKASKKEEKSKN